MNARSPSLDDIFFAAREVTNAEDRAAYLDRVCRDDEELRRRVERLLDAQSKVGSFLEAPPPAPTVSVNGSALTEGSGAVIGPYKLLEPIGEGGMGVVYMAEQVQPIRRKVALKIIKPGMDTKQVIARFEAERKALALMDHPNIARVLDAGATESGRPYFVMELVRGIPITEYCDREKLSIPDRLGLFVTVCQAVQHAHQKGIIHRDIKPSNVMVTLHDGVPVPKVIDFGIAKAMGQSLTEKTLFTGYAHLIGTPLYMSPEQAEFSGLDVDTRTDIYSLGVLLYELLTGTTPFDQETLRKAALDEVRRIIREQEPPRPSTRLSTLGEASTTVSANRQADPRHLNRTLRGELDWIVMKALEKDRRRYETANDFAADVMRYLTDQPVEACPPSAWYRFRKYARRNRAGLTTMALVVAALVAGTAVSAWQAVRASAAERRTRNERDLAVVAEAKARAMADFLTADLLRQAEPAKNAPEDHVTLLEILDRASEKVGRRFAGQPDVEFELRFALATSYHGLAAWDKSERELRALRELARRPGADPADGPKVEAELAHLQMHRGEVDGSMLSQARSAAESLARLKGPDDPYTLSSRSHLAQAHLAAGRVSEAVTLLEANLAVEEKRLGLDHPGTVSTRANLADAYRRAGRLTEAVRMQEANLRLAESVLGTDHAETLGVRHTLAAAYIAAGRYAEAITLLQANLKLSESRLGQSHPLTIADREELAVARNAAGRSRDAVALHEVAMKQVESRHGSDHPQTLKVRNNLATAYMDTGRVFDAIPLLEATLKQEESIFGPDHPETLICRGNLAGAYNLAGRTAEAIALLEATLRQKESTNGPDHPDTLVSRGNLANAYLEAERFAEAIALHEANLRRLESAFGGDGPTTLVGRNNLACAYVEGGRVAEGVALHHATLTRRESALGHDHPYTLTGRANVAYTYLAVGRITEAIGLLEATRKVQESTLGSDHPNVLDTLTTLVRAYLAARRLTDALPLAEYTVQLSRAKRGPYHPRTMIAMNDLATAYLEGQRWADAERTARECMGLRDKKRDDWWTFHTMSQLGTALAGQKNYAEAEPLLLQGYDGLKAREAKIPFPRKDSLASAAARIVKLYEAWGKPEQAEDWRRRSSLMSPELPDDVFALLRSD
jgi:serine/threonine protein kinase